MRKIYVFCVLAIWFLVGCGKEEDAVKVPTSEIPVIEGYYMTSITGDVINVIGIPNNINQSNGIWMSHPFPNPAKDLSYIQVNLSANFKHAKLWVTPALLADQEINPGAMNNGVYFVAGGFPVMSYEITDTLDRMYVLPASPGAYRVYLLCDKTLLYDNLIITE